ncbi:UTP--glucose-1-phosphate uridylyltransferase [Georgenia sp. Z1491]|uniref:UTP--glucose-1-phosphate uridylyltransferase n=1 Tax=Georgenia sp. Z1491 TaxID=3416707 RepID=UPI003CEB2FFD
MTDSGLDAALRKMADAGTSATARRVFAAHYEDLGRGASGTVPESTLSPLDDVPRLADVEVDEEAADAALRATALVRLNGGLGTSMGMTGPKSLLPVRDGRSFLDLVIEQVRSARASSGATLPLILMQSFRTQEPTREALAAHPDVAVEGLPADFVQNRVPRLREDDLAPVEWPEDPDLEWAPPGHGDLYTVLHDVGLPRTLLDAGYRYLSVSNIDNLGATPDGRLAGWFAASGAPFAMEVCRRTRADRKGGHLAVRTDDDRLVLREIAQTDEEDLAAFRDVDRHRYFNTNSLWFDLEALDAALTERDGVLALPLIRNVKSVDPADKTSTRVVQVETAMGAAIELFDGAVALEVGRDRFLPVKTTDDLLLVRSDAYDLDDDARLVARADPAPDIDLDRDVYALVAALEERFPAGPPSLRGARSFAVEGDVTFGADVVVTGDVVVRADDVDGRVVDGTRLGEV